MTEEGPKPFPVWPFLLVIASWVFSIVVQGDSLWDFFLQSLYISLLLLVLPFSIYFSNVKRFGKNYWTNPQPTKKAIEEFKKRKLFFSESESKIMIKILIVVLIVPFFFWRLFGVAIGMTILLFVFALLILKSGKNRKRGLQMLGMSFLFLFVLILMKFFL